MTRHRPYARLVADRAALLLHLAPPAAAGGDLLCCGAEVQVYVVNQGPLFSGPGHYLRRESPDTYPGGYFGGYPYVGTLYTGYPYGLQDVGGYPRGTYSPFAGYPYVEPPPGLNAPSFYNYRIKPGRVYRQLRGTDAEPLAR